MADYDDIRPIRGWDGCFITSDGRIFRNGKEKKLSISRVGYKVVSFSRNNKTHTFYLHRLLLDAFVGPCPDGCEALHGNGERLDNRIENLRWGTRAENVADAIRHGTATIGSKNKQAKLRQSDIGWIHDMKTLGFFSREIAPHFQVSATTINRVASGKTYKMESA